jgi:Subtilase family
MKRDRLWMLGAAGAMLLLQPISARAQSDTVAAERLAQLTYRLPVAPSEMIADPAQMMWLANAVEQNTAAIIAANVIEDRATLSGLRATRRTAALVRGDFAAAAQLNEAGLGRPALGTDLLLAALRAGPNSVAVRRSIRRSLDRRDSSERSAVIALRRELALASSAYRLGEISGFADPEWQRDPVVGQDFADGMLRLWVEINLRNPFLNVFESELERWLARHPDTDQNIWPQREAPIGPQDANPVSIAVWDGVDSELFSASLVVEPGDAPNEMDDDRDGFVDEAAGLAFDERFLPTSGLLMPLSSAIAVQLADFERYKRGIGDLAMGRNTPDVAFARTLRRSLTASGVVAFEQGYDVYTNYSHGTLVSDLAIRGIPRVTLVPVRITFSNESPSPLLDEAAAARFVQMVTTATRYMRERGVRVCNISWGFTAQDIEGSLREHGMEPDPIARSRRARAIFATMQEGMASAVAASPGILFVVSAGNAGQNIDYAGDLPGTINLPNILTVGAVDERGQLASFASSGASVDLYAHGTNIESVVPGGGRMRASGASLSAPQVVNAAARLLAVRPNLGTAELASLLVRTATPLPGSSLPLLDARAAMTAARSPLGTLESGNRK